MKFSSSNPDLILSSRKLYIEFVDFHELQSIQDGRGKGTETLNVRGTDEEKY